MRAQRHVYQIYCGLVWNYISGTRHPNYKFSLSVSSLPPRPSTPQTDFTSSLSAFAVFRAKNINTLPDLCVSSLRRGHANLLCTIPILTDDPRRKSEVRLLNSTSRGVGQLSSQGHPALYPKARRPPPECRPVSARSAPEASGLPLHGGPRASAQRPACLCPKACLVISFCSRRGS